MKRTKNGAIKLEKGEIKLGEFIVRAEEQHYKISTTSGNWSMRVGENMLVYGLIRESLKLENKNPLQNWIVVMYNATCTVPDMEFMQAVQDASTACIERNPAVYGSPALTDAEDQQILDEMQADYEATENLKNEVKAE